MDQKEKIYKVISTKDQFASIIIKEVDELSKPDTEWRFEDNLGILNDYATGTEAMRFFYVHTRDMNLSDKSEVTFILAEILSDEYTVDRVDTLMQILAIYIKRELTKSQIIQEVIDRIAGRGLTYPPITGNLLPYLD